MSDVRIDVRGEARTRIQPERAVVHATVTADGPEPEAVKQQVSALLSQVRGDLESMLASAVVSQFAIDQIRVSSHRPWNDQGEQRPLVHVASVGLTAEFTDFSELSWVMRDGLTVHYIEWSLTEATQTEVERRTRQQALRNAVTHAQDYADALDLGTVRVLSVRDPGVLPEPEPHMLMARSASMDSGGAPEVDLVPSPIEVVAEVHAGFTVI